MHLRVYWANCSEFSIQQKWASDTGEEKWEDLEHFFEPQPPKPREAQALGGLISWNKTPTAWQQFKQWFK